MKPDRFSPNEFTYCNGFIPFFYNDTINKYKSREIPNTNIQGLNTIPIVNVPGVARITVKLGSSEESRTVGCIHTVSFLFLLS